MIPDQRDKGEHLSTLSPSIQLFLDSLDDELHVEFGAGVQITDITLVYVLSYFSQYIRIYILIGYIICRTDGLLNQSTEQPVRNGLGNCAHSHQTTR
jgi:hypothetical protein